MSRLRLAAAPGRGVLLPHARQRNGDAVLRGLFVTSPFSKSAAEARAASDTFDYCSYNDLFGYETQFSFRLRKRQCQSEFVLTWYP